MPNVVEFPFPNLDFLKGQEVPKNKIELSNNVDIDISVGTRDEIIARLRQLPEILGKTDGEIATILGIAPAAWSNYKAESTGVTIRPMVALTMWDAFGIPMEWVYDGQTARTPDSAMRAKLVAANRAAEAWLASRPRKGTLPRIALIMVMGAGLFAGYPAIGYAVDPIPDRPSAKAAYFGAVLECKGQAVTIMVERGLTPEQFDSIYVGCLAHRGWIVHEYGP